MKFDQTTTDELNILLQYDLSSSQQGIKIHHEAEPNMIAAAKRLNEKGFIDQADGGYLTALGRTAAEHVRACFDLLH